MSAETKRALDEAIAAHVASEHEDDGIGTTIVTGYVLQTALIATGDEESTTRYLSCGTNGQSAHVTLGLARRLSLRLDRLAGQ